MLIIVINTKKNEIQADCEIDEKNVNNSNNLVAVTITRGPSELSYRVLRLNQLNIILIITNMINFIVLFI